MVPRASDEVIVGESDARKRSLMPRDNLKQMSGLHVPRVNIIRIKRTSKHYLPIWISFQTNQLTPDIRMEHSELLLLDDVVSIDCPV